MDKKKTTFIFSERLASAFVMLPAERKAEAINHIVAYGLGRRDSSDDELLSGLEAIIDRDNEPKAKVPAEDVAFIIDYLNRKCGTHYRRGAQLTKRLINARYNEKFTRDDFIKVIDLKTREWQGTKFEKYLCPETLFGTKFEKYLNGKPGDEAFAESSFETDDFFTAASLRAYGGAQK